MEVVAVQLLEEVNQVWEQAPVESPAPRVLDGLRFPLILVTITGVLLALESSQVSLVGGARFQARPVVDLVSDLAELLGDLENNEEIKFLEDRRLEAALVQAVALVESLQSACPKVDHQVRISALKTLETAFPRASVNRVPLVIRLGLQVALE